MRPWPGTAALRDFSPSVSPSKRTWTSLPRYLPLKLLAYLALRFSALHMMVSQEFGHGA